MVILAVGPNAAAAKPGYVVSPRSHVAALSLKGTHGYGIEITEWDRRFGMMLAGGHRSAASYLIHNSRDEQRRGVGEEIHARFPGIGHVSVVFHPVGPPHHEPGSFFPMCEGGETTEQPGYFTGSIHLRGEQAYTSVHATRAHGEVITTAKEVCKRSIPGKPPRQLDQTQIAARSSSGGQLIGFTGTTTKHGAFSTTSFIGYTRERREGMDIFREALAAGSTGDLLTGNDAPHPPSATVTPPSPFHGSAAFQRTSSGETTWTGSLSAVLPGLGRVELAGPDFRRRYVSTPAATTDTWPS
jgi:hypothetical protein